MAKYPVVKIFTKKGNLTDYLMTEKIYDGMFDGDPRPITRENYAREREIQLILLKRFDGTKQYCKIKCPVNPLPVKGEFEVPRGATIEKWLMQNGWCLKDMFYTRMFE